MELYHADPCEGPSISSSGLRTIHADSPAHYWVHSPYNPKRIEETTTAAFVLGRAAHHLLLGEDNFSTSFIVRPDELAGKAWQGNRTECKDWLAKQEASGRTVLTPAQIESIRGMAYALAAHPLIDAGMLNGSIEQSMFWKDHETGIWLKSRPDAIPNDSGDFADLKTTTHFGFDLDRDVSNYRYDMQAALAGMGCRALLGREMESFSLVFVGKEPPYCVEILTLDKEDIQRAERDIRVAIDTFAWCMEHGNWFGPQGTQLDARYVRISDWAKTNADYRSDFLKREIARAEAVTSEVEYAGAP